MSDIVLDTELLGQFFLFYAHKDYDIKTAARLFARLRPFVCTARQLLECGIPQEGLQAILATKGMWHIHTLSDAELSREALYSELVAQSRFQVLLAHETQFRNFVSINIHDDAEPIQLLYAGRYAPGQNRPRALLHLQKLIASAHEQIEIHDNYMDADYAPTLQQLCTGTTCRLICYTHSTRQTVLQNALRALDVEARVKPYDSRRKHDRYIVIDSQLEILLSSGVRYIQDTDKDFTYIIREKRR